jgi:amino acid transporter
MRRVVPPPTLTLAIKDIARVSASASPVASIIRDQLGRVMERILLTGIVVAMFGAGMVILASCSWMAFAMARDSRFSAHKVMRRVNPRTQTPVPATILILVVGIILMVPLPGAALLKLIVGSTILPALIYGAIVVLYLSVRKRLERKEGGFSLGRFEVPVAIAALISVAFGVFGLVLPPEALVPDLIVDPGRRGLLRQDADLQPRGAGHRTWRARCFLTLAGGTQHLARRIGNSFLSGVESGFRAITGAPPDRDY